MINNKIGFWFSYNQPSQMSDKIIYYITISVHRPFVPKTTFVILSINNCRLTISYRKTTKHTFHNRYRESQVPSNRWTTPGRSSKEIGPKTYFLYTFSPPNGPIFEIDSLPEKGVRSFD